MMKFNRLDDNKLQIILNKEDLSKRNIAKWDLLPSNPQAQKIFQDILDEAYEECGFEVGNNAQLMIEAFPLTAESILITVTKVDSNFREDLERELANLSNKILGEIDDSDEETEIIDDVIYRFDDLEEVINLAQALPEIHDDSALYRYSGKYYLYFPQTPPTESTVYGYLDEYGVEMQLVHDFLSEHGEVMIAKNALERLCEL